jgi:hypothetical protein
LEAATSAFQILSDDILLSFAAMQNGVFNQQDTLVIKQLEKIYVWHTASGNCC